MRPQLGALLMAPKVGYQYILAGTVLAPDVQHLKQEFLKNTSCKPLFSLGFVVDDRVVLCAVVTLVLCPLIPVCSKLLLGLPAAKPIESQVPVIGSAGDECRVSHSYCCWAIGLQWWKRLFPSNFLQGVSEWHHLFHRQEQRCHVCLSCWRYHVFHDLCNG